MYIKKIPVFFCEEMVVLKEQESPSPKKPKALVEQWLQKYPIEIKEVIPVSLSQINAVHDPDFVTQVLSGFRDNGFGSRDVEVIDSLPYTNGSFLSAAREALSNNLVAVSPTSGFHHATYDNAMGYCTFNGLMIAAKQLFENGEASHIGILDCDYHYGNGTDDILAQCDLGGEVIHYTGRQSYPYDSKKFFHLLPHFLKSMVHCDILFYQAGADCHINDPFGGFLTTEEMRLRDQIVFQFCYDNSLPIVWNLAGGYQEEILPNGTKSIQKVLDLHNNTMEECLKVYSTLG